MDARGTFDSEYLEIRARLLQLAAALDRIDRAEGSVADDPRRQWIARGLEVLSEAAPDRAEQIQLIFSQPYVAEWRREFDLAAATRAAQ